MKVVFPFIAQRHQVMHSLPIAAAMSQAHPEVEVHVAAATPAFQRELEALVGRHAPGAKLCFSSLSLGRFDAIRSLASGVPWKLASLFRHREFFGQFDGLITPERTSLFLRRFGVARPRFVWTRHGAGDRGIGFASDVRDFDFVCLAGIKIERRLLSQRLIEPGRYASGIYAKFDWHPPNTRSWMPFANRRPTVLYTPHFKRRLSSWSTFGRDVLDYFASSRDFNLIFAPHVRLFDVPTPAKYRAFEEYARLPHMLVDLGSERSSDLSYTRAADLYLGDVSSQVAEFVTRPRPCIFLDSHRGDWRDDPDYAFWRLGPVLTSSDQLGEALTSAWHTHDRYLGDQVDYARASFGDIDGFSAARAADAIVAFLERETKAMPRSAGRAPSPYPPMSIGNSRQRR